MRSYRGLLAFLLIAGCGDDNQQGNPPDQAVPIDMAVRCADDKSCMAGHCDPLSGQCVACVKDDHCPDGQVCKNAKCVAGCNAGHGCGDGGVCEVDAGTCFTCQADNDCVDPANPRCDVPSGRCVACLPQNDNCPLGRFCVQVNGAWQCSLGCKTDDECKGADGGAPSSACCNNVCADTAGDSANCGACGKACMNGESCCSSACKDLTSDVANCGACASACKLANATPACTKSLCTVAACDNGFADCDQQPQNGCEVNTQTDPANCSACGKACQVANAVAGCAMGACTIASCNAGFADCNMQVGDGCEVNAQTDVNNCGACGKVCALANATATCAMGGCAIAVCTMGFADCDNNPADGCEVATTSDVANCGGCGNACMLPNATPSCTNGLCTVMTCKGAFADCNMMPGDGCEVDTGTDVANCGGCGKVCVGVHVEVNKCANGACAIGSCTNQPQINQVYADCDNNAADGCEVNIFTDPNNCGTCGKVCSGMNANELCSGGKCSVAACTGSFLDCDKDPANGCEVNKLTDGNNCGACGNVCPNGAACNSGVCGVAPFGNGTDGALNVGAGTTTIDQTATSGTGTAGQGTLTLGNPNGFGAGKVILIHQSQGAGAGNWELNLIVGVNGATATLLTPLKNTYQNGGNNHAQTIVVPQYTTVSVPNGATLTAPAWNGATGGILVFQANNSTTVGGAVSMSARGYRGTGHGCFYRCATGVSGEGQNGPGAVSSAANGEGGGAGTAGQDCGEGGGGSYGTAGAAGPNGTVGTCAGNPHLGGSAGGVAGAADLNTAILFGGAGGEGGGDEDGGNPGAGGNGGGIIILFTPTITVTGAITSDGSVGADGNQGACGGAGCGMAGGGGGAGGAIRLSTNTATLGANLVHAVGGGGGACTCGGNAGGGGGGRVAVKGTATGTTSPAFFGG